jgi:hypothetical protein
MASPIGADLLRVGNLDAELLLERHPDRRCQEFAPRSSTNDARLDLPGPPSCCI